MLIWAVIVTTSIFMTSSLTFVRLHHSIQRSHPQQIIVLLYISCDCDHIPSGVGLVLGLCTTDGQRVLSLQMDTADRAPERIHCWHQTHCVSFMLILLCISLLLCLCTSPPLHPLILNKLVRHSTVIVFFLSFYHLFSLLFFLLPDMIHVCPPFFTHMCTHTLMHTSPSLILSILSGSAPVW